MIDFLNYVPVEGSIGEHLIHFIFIVLSCSFIFFVVFMFIRWIKKNLEE